MLNNVNYDIDITKEPPADDTARQYYFIEKAKAYVQRESEELGRPLTFCVTTFGCQMNARDSEKLCGILEKIGYVEAAEDEADFIIFNTCTVRENANMRVYGRLGQLKPRKKKNPHMMIGLCGCMMQEPEVVEKLKTSYRYVDIIFGTHNIFKFAELIVTRFESQRMVIDIWKDTDKIVENLPNDRKFSFKSGVNIMFGCNNFCSYCIVPYVRGRERSREPEAIVKEIEALVADGVTEVMLLGQNVNSYGKDLPDEINFPELLERINAIDGEFIIRFMSSHPKDAGKELIDTIIRCEKVGRHFHLPVQSGSNDILEKMNRRYTVERYMETINYARSIIPDFSFTTDIIVGFPNESEEDFEKTLEIMKRVGYDNIYSFIYSKRSGTKAAEINDLISDEEKSQRMTRLLALQREISTENYKRFIGRKMRVLVDGKGKREGWLTGKSSEFIIVEFEGDESLTGSFADVEIIGAKNWAVKNGYYFNGKRIRKAYTGRSEI